MADLRRALVETRRRGHAVEEDLVTVGLSSVSRPVLDHTGHPVAAVAVTFEGDRVDEPARLALVRAVGHAVDALAHRLGATLASARPRRVRTSVCRRGSTRF